MILALNREVATVVIVRGLSESNLEEASTDETNTLSKYLYYSYTTYIHLTLSIVFIILRSFSKLRNGKHYQT
jgi:hypothetical protein